MFQSGNKRLTFIAALLRVMLLLSVLAAVVGCEGAKTTVVGRFPKSAMSSLGAGAPVLQDRILVVGLEPFGLYSGTGEKTFVFQLANDRYKKVFATERKKGWPQLPFSMRGCTSRNGSRLLFQWPTPHSGLRMLDLAGGKYIWETREPVSVSQARGAFSRDETMFVAVRRKSDPSSKVSTPELWLYDSKTGKPFRQLAQVHDPDGRFEPYGFCRNSDRIQFIEHSGHGTVSLWETDIKAAKPRLQCKIADALSVEPSPNGTQVVVQRSNDPKSLILLDKHGATLRTLYDMPVGEQLMSAIWSPDSKYLALSIQKSSKYSLVKKERWSIVVVDAARGTVASRWDVEQCRCYPLGWYGDSRRLACAQFEKQETLIVQLVVN